MSQPRRTTAVLAKTLTARQSLKQSPGRPLETVGSDLNNDGINMVIIDRYGRIKDVKTECFQR